MEPKVNVSSNDAGNAVIAVEFEDQVCGDCEGYDMPIKGGPCETCQEITLQSSWKQAAEPIVEELVSGKKYDLDVDHATIMTGTIEELEELGYLVEVD